MKTPKFDRQLIVCALGAALSLTLTTAKAAGEGWSVVPYFGLSQMGDQSLSIAGAEGITPGSADAALDTGFAGGLSVRYDYTDSRWSSEFGWEYRSNDSDITLSDGTTLPSGNYASNTFYLNGRFALSDGGRFTPWVGGGLTVIQEIDLDSETPQVERSFSDTGSVGFQVMVGADYDISDRFYLTSELRYSSQTDLELSEEEGGGGTVSNIEYQPVTVGLGIGFRF